MHVDCDAFYASVEELDRPELKEGTCFDHTLEYLLTFIVPMAVGSGVLTTCNYKAREFGVRSGMAGYIAKRWCSINHVVHDSDIYRTLSTTGVSPPKLR